MLDFSPCARSPDETLVSSTVGLAAADRLLVVAPHPDDESLATGGLLQHALALKAPTRIVYWSTGENNTWAQRVSERRWRIGAQDRERFATRRKAEVRAALQALGVADTVTAFLGFPDQGITDLLMRADAHAFETLVGVLHDWRPTLVAAPSALDYHPDHSALAVLLDQALVSSGWLPPACRRLRYLVHNPWLRAHPDGALELPLSSAQVAGKRAAIRCHATQLAVRRSWLLGFADPPERYFEAEPPHGLQRHPLRALRRNGADLVFDLVSWPHARAFGRRTLCLLIGAPDAAPVRLTVDLPRHSGATVVRDARSGVPVALAHFAGRGGNGHLRLSSDLLPGARVFAKLERRYGFFDEAGWRSFSLEL